MNTIIERAARHTDNFDKVEEKSKRWISELGNLRLTDSKTGKTAEWLKKYVGALKQI